MVVISKRKRKLSRWLEGKEEEMYQSGCYRERREKLPRIKRELKRKEVLIAAGNRRIELSWLP